MVQFVEFPAEIQQIAPNQDNISIGVAVWGLLAKPIPDADGRAHMNIVSNGNETSGRVFTVSSCDIVTQDVTMDRDEARL